MIRNSVSSIIFHLALASILISTLAVYGLSQPSQHEPGIADKDTLRHSEMAICHPDSTHIGTGWLIIDGYYISGPYHVTVEGNVVYANGIRVTGKESKPLDYWQGEPDSLALERFFEDSTVSPGFRQHVREISRDKERMHAMFEKGEFYDSLFAKYAVWARQSGVEEARNLAFEYMSAHPMIDTAYRYAKSPMAFAIRFKGDQFVREILLNEPPTESSTLLEHHDERILQSVQRLQEHLDNGSLIIAQDGRWSAIAYPRSYAAFDKMQEIMVSTTDIQTRAVAIRKIIPMKDAAEAIAKYLQIVDE